MGRKVYLVSEFRNMVLADLPKAMRDNILSCIGKTMHLRRMSDRMEQKFLAASLTDVSQYINLYHYITVIC